MADSQRGIALISVLGAIAVITALLAGMAYRQTLDLNVQAYALQKNNALITLLSIEQLARAILTKKGDGEVAQYDYYEEDWAEPVEGLMIGGINVTFMIFDAQAKLNVNNANSGNSRDRRLAREMLRAAMKGYGNTYREVYDWVSQPSAGKDSFYLRDNSQFDSYRVAGTSMVTVQEMRLMRGLREKETLDTDIETLQDRLAFLPTQKQFIKMNVNTVSEDLLRGTLDYFRSGNRFNRVVSAKPYRNINTFCNRLRSRRSDCRRVFDNKSSYFYLYARMNLGERIVLTRSLIRRKNNNAYILAREMKSL